MSSGRLELVTGGWVAADEGNTHYRDIINQLVEGNDWIHSHLDARPKAGYPID